jgi:hypothetical protein
MSNLTQELIDGVTRDQKEWHPTPSARGTEKRLTLSIKTAENASRAPSLEKARYNAGEELTEDDPLPLENFDPGTFVETRRYARWLYIRNPTFTSKMPEMRFQVME